PRQEPGPRGGLIETRAVSYSESDFDGILRERRRVSEGNSPKWVRYCLEKRPKCRKPQRAASPLTLVSSLGFSRPDRTSSMRTWRKNCIGVQPRFLRKESCRVREFTPAAWQTSPSEIGRWAFARMYSSAAPICQLPAAALRLSNRV